MFPNIGVTTLSLAIIASPGEDWLQYDNTTLERWGFVNVCLPPFNADPAGTRDCTQAIQEAVNYARERQLVCLFPPGQYLVSNTIVCEQYRPLRTPTRRVGDRNHPCVLMGMEIRGKRPCLVLSSRSPGFTDPEHPKPVLYFWAAGNGEEMPIDQPQPNISMNQMIVGMDLRLGDNPGAVGISHRAAQGSGIQDCTIDARGAYCGVEGGAGSGGSHAGITVIGGRYGLDLRGTQPAATVVGVTLIGQEDSAILCSGRQATTIVGFRVVRRSSAPAIFARQNWIHQGQLNLIDGSVEVEGTSGGCLLDTTAAVYLRNVYVRGMSAIVRSPAGNLEAPSEGWCQVEEAAIAVPPNPWRGKQLTTLGVRELRYTSDIWIDGARWPKAIWAKVFPSKEPEGDFVRRHLWGDDFPRPWSPGVVNVRLVDPAPVGDGLTDDSEVLQQAIDRYPKLFLPKGQYLVTRPLRLRPDTQLVGAHRCFSWLVASAKEGGEFADPANPRPVLQTANDPNATTILGFFGVQLDISSTGAYAVDWAAGPRSLFRDVNVGMPTRWQLRAGVTSPRFDHPLVVIHDRGGGKWYNFHQESWHFQGPNYRHLVIRGARGPLHFYQCNVEHSRSHANMEVQDSKDVFFYGVKGEYNRPIARFVRCCNFALFGYGGNAAAWPGTSLFEIEDCDNYRLTLLLDTPRLPGQGSPDHFAGEGVDPRLWFMVHERYGDKKIQTPPLDRPTLFSRGTLEMPFEKK
jgi:hypothetical protein